MAELPPRSAIAPEHTWNAESVFAEAEQWQAELAALKTDIPDFSTKFTGRLAEGPSVLADFMDAANDLQRRIGKVYTYSMMSYSVDTTNQAATAMAGQGRNLFSLFASAIAFAEPEMLGIGRETLEKWVAEDERLSNYGQYVDDLFRQQEHIRSAEVEAILGMLSDPFQTVSTTASMLTNADMRFAPAVGADGKEAPLAQGTRETLLKSPDRTLRKSAYENFTDGYLAFKNTLASNLTASMKQDAFNARVRGHESSLHAALFPHNVPVEVFHNLVDTFKKNIPTWHKYWAIRRKALGVDSLQPYDIWAPISAKQPEVSYHQAVEWIVEGMGPLGAEYVDPMRAGCLDDRWVDIYPNEGKRQGAFSNGSHDTFPFIMMSYDDTIFGMSTLAHELGHSMHSYMSRKHQTVTYSRYSLFAAEVASNFNQAMVRHHLINSSDDKDFQIAVIEEAMSNFHRYFFIMPTLARFELEMHSRVAEGDSPTANDMIEYMAEVFAEGYGEEMGYERDRIGITWATFSHLYVSFYTFQYATGISAAHTLSNRILAGEEGAVEAYLTFLKSGSSDYPINLLQQAGVDLSQPLAVEETFGVLAGYVDKLESLIG
ncbi:MAG: oligoendopeptidase F [Chloroflexi bacterium]|nr:oligoendopeptidase F [Chloroflexota bacterium]